MSDVVVIQGRVDTGNSVKDLADIGKNFDTIKDKAKAVSDVDKRFAELKSKLDAGGLSLRELNKLTKDFTDLSAQAGRETPIGQQAIMQAAKLKDQVGDLKQEVNRLANDGIKMQAALQLGGTVVSGFAAVKGVTAMLGIENEKMLETITQLQAATSTLAAIEQVRAAFEKESFLMIQAKIIATKAYTAVQWALNAAMNSFPLTLILSGLAALGISIAGIVSKFKIFAFAWDGIKLAVEKVIAAISISIKAVKDFAAATIDFIENSKAMRIALGIITFGMSELYLAGIRVIKNYYAQKEAADAAAEAEKKRRAELSKKAGENAQAIMKEIKLLDEKNKAEQLAHDKEVSNIDFAIRKRQAAGQEYGYLERKKLEMIIHRAKKELEIEEEKNNKLRELVKMQAELYGVTQEEILKQAKKNGIDVEAIEKNRLKVVEEQKQKIEKAEQDLAVFRISEGKKFADKKKEQEKEVAQTAINEALRQKKELEALELLRLQNTADSLEKRKQLYLLAYEKERQDIINEHGRNSELLKELEIKKQYDLGLIEIEYQKRKQDERIKLEQEQELAAKEKADRILKHEKELADARVAIERGILSSLTSLGEIFIKDQRKLQMFQAHVTAAQMALDTAKAISGAVAAGASQPFPMNIAAIATGVATVLANIATAVKAYRQANLGSAPSVSSGGGGGASNNQGSIMPRENPNGNLTAGFLGNNNSMQKVVILQSELEMNNELSNKIKVQSVI